VLLEYLRNSKTIWSWFPRTWRSGASQGFAKRLDASLAIIDKRRGTNVSQVMNSLGIRGLVAVILDDIVIQGDSVRAAQALMEGAKRV